MKKLTFFQQSNDLKSISFVLFMCFFAYTTQAQMKYWPLFPSRFDMSIATPTATTIASAPAGSYGHGNGAYDESGNILFYVRDGSIHNANGTIAGTLGTNPIGTGYTFQGLQIGIVPKPGTCRQFYIIYTRMNVQGGTALLFMEVNATNPNAVTLASTSATFIGQFNGNAVGIAVSPVTSGTGATAKRFLFGSGGQYLKRFEISNTGIGSEATLASISSTGFSSVGFSTCELELVKPTPTSYKLAWGSDSKVYRVDLDGTGTYVNNSIVTTIMPTNSGTVRGVEFTTGSSPKLYVSTGNMDVLNGSLTESTQGGIYQISGTTTTFITGTIQLSGTQLERASNGKIYGVRAIFTSGSLASTALVGINTSTNALSADISYTSGYGNWTNGGFVWETFTLPNQIDEENYTYFFGESKVTVTNISINGNSTDGTVCATPNNVYNCVAIPFVPTYTGGTPTQFKFIIQATNASCQVMMGAAYLNYQGTYTNGTPTANLDLRTLTDAAMPGKNLGNVTGRHVVSYFVKDACGNESVQTRYLNVSAAPSPTGILMLNLGNSTTYSACTNAVPSSCTVLMGKFGGSFNLANSTGNITYYQIVSILEVNCTSGATIATIPANTVQQNVTAVNTLIGINLNSMTTNWFGSKAAGYFTNKCFKITVKVGNPCTSTDVWSYFKVDETNFAGSEDRDVTDDFIIGGIRVAPNPFQDGVEFTVQTSSEHKNQDVASKLFVTDITGKIVARLNAENATNESNILVYQLNAAPLPDGVYIYHVVTSDKSYSGKIIKSN
jgi:Secretion system C-terminal sorting domain